MRGECINNPDFMLANCAKTCHDFSSGIGTAKHMTPEELNDLIGFGGRKKRKTTKRKSTKHKSTKRKTKRKSKARMTKQKRKVNGVTRTVRISSTGRKYVLLKGKRHYL